MAKAAGSRREAEEETERSEKYKKNGRPRGCRRISAALSCGCTAGTAQCRKVRSKHTLYDRTATVRSANARFLPLRGKACCHAQK